MTQNLSGVQRFAGEITSALSRIWPEQSEARPVVLTPGGALADGFAEAGMYGLVRRETGRRHGQAWEQLELARAARGGVLINLGNTAPILSGRQLVVLHDAAVFSQPQGYSRPFRLWYRTLHTLLRLGRTKLVTVSAFSRSELSRHLRVPAEQIALVGEGAEHILRTVPDETVLARHGLERGKFVLAVGNLAPHKNLAGLRELSKRLAARNIPLAISGGLNHAVFSGSGDLPDPATLLGRVSDAELHALYRAAACFVFPSRYEGFGLPVVEAMACACPVVAASIPALREVGGTAALYADPEDPAAIADAVLSVLDQPEKAAALRAAGLARAASFTWESAARTLLDIAYGLSGKAA